MHRVQPLWTLGSDHQASFQVQRDSDAIIGNLIRTQIIFIHKQKFTKRLLFANLRKEQFVKQSDFHCKWIDSRRIFSNPVKNSLHGKKEHKAL